MRDDRKKIEIAIWFTLDEEGEHAMDAVDNREKGRLEWERENVEDVGEERW